MNEKLKTLPVSFSIVDEVQGNDTRFLKIVIDVLHTGMNYNGSIFNEDVVNEAIPSIKNTPILGYILVDENGDTDDFTEHEFIMRKKNGKYDFVYAGSAYGVIPESCEPRWINKVCSDGKLRKFLQVDALLWTKFDRAIEIFNRDIVKGQSMELADNYEGVENDDGSFTFTKFLFNGCCILSTTDPHIQPAMINSTAKAIFSADHIAREIKEKLDEYASIVNQDSTKNGCPEYEKSKEGGFDLNKEQLDILAKYNVDSESLDFSIDVDMSLEDFEQKVSALAAAKPDIELEAESEVDPDAPDVEDGTEDDSAHEDGNESEGETGEVPNGETAQEDVPESNLDGGNFALNSNIVNELYEALSIEKIEDEYWGMIPRYTFLDFDYEALVVYAYDCTDWKPYGFGYRMNGDKAAIDFDSRARMKFVLAPFVDGEKEPDLPAVFASLKAMSKEKADGSVSELQTKYDQLNRDYSALVEKENARLAAEETSMKEDLFSKFEKELSGETEFIDLKENASSISAEDLETKLFAMIGKKKTNFSAKEKKYDKVRIPGSVPVIPNPYGDLFD